MWRKDYAHIDESTEIRRKNLIFNNLIDITIMKKIRLLSVFLASSLLLLLGLMSCVPNKDVSDGKEEITLNLDKEEITLANSGGQEKISVNTNSSQWDFYVNTNESWLQVSKEGNELLVSVAANPNMEKRTATLVVFAGGTSEKLSITQSSADLVFSFSEDDSLELPSQGGLKLVEIKSNSKSWKLSPLDASIDWLTVKGGDNSEVFVLEAKPNSSFDVRTASIEVELSNGAKKLMTINQLGQAKFLLPFDQEWREYSEYNLIKYEQKRGSIMNQYMFPQVDTWGEATPGKIVFSTSSSVMPLIIYTTSFNDPKYGQAVLKLMYADPENRVEVEEYAKFLTDNNFVEISPSSTPEKTRNFARIDEKAIVIIDFDPAHADYALVGFVPIYPQEQEYATFPALPRGANGKVYDLLNKEDKKIEDVLALEEATGGIEDGRVSNQFDETQVAKILFNESPVKPEDEDMRLYSFYVSSSKKNFPDEYLGSVNEILFFFKNYTQAVYLKPKNSGWDTTNEFYELLEKEGYRYQGKNGETQLYIKRVDPEIVEVLHVTYDQDEQILGGHGRAEIGYFQFFDNTIEVKSSPNKLSSLKYQFKLNKEGEYSLKEVR